MPKNFDIIAKEQFKYLIDDYGFRLDKLKRDGIGYEVRYLSSLCAVHIEYEIREAYLFVMLHKLVNGKFVENPRPIVADSVLTGYSLDDILLLRAPGAMIKPAYTYGESSKFYDKERGLTLFVSKFAENLRTYAADILTGNFAVFRILEPVVKARASNYAKSGSL